MFYKYLNENLNAKIRKKTLKENSKYEYAFTVEVITQMLQKYNFRG